MLSGAVSSLDSIEVLYIEWWLMDVAICTYDCWACMGRRQIYRILNMYGWHNPHFIWRFSFDVSLSMFLFWRLMPSNKYETLIWITFSSKRTQRWHQILHLSFASCYSSLWPSVVGRGQPKPIKNPFLNSEQFSIYDDTVTRPNNFFTLVVLVAEWHLNTIKLSETTTNISRWLADLVAWEIGDLSHVACSIQLARKSPSVARLLRTNVPFQGAYDHL